MLSLTGELLEESGQGQFLWKAGPAVVSIQMEGPSGVCPFAC